MSIEMDVLIPRQDLQEVRFVAFAEPLLALTMDQTSRPWAIILGIIFAIIAISLAVASWTRWGQSKPLTKCVALAVLAHVWLLMYAYGTRVIHPGNGRGSQITHNENGPVALEVFSSSLSEPAQDSDGKNVDKLQQWERPVSVDANQIIPESQAEPQSSMPTAMAEVALSVPPSLLQPEKPTALPQRSDLSQDTVQPVAPEPIDSSSNADIQQPLQKTAGLSEPVPSEDYSIDKLRIPDVNANPIASLVSRANPLDQAMLSNQNSTQAAANSQPMPEIYQLRFSPQRLQIARQNGGDETSEAAVNAALNYLARKQERDGSWNAAASGAGRETQALGENRGGTGAKADTAMTGLAILAFLGAGHTHNAGDYREHLMAGLEYLMASQMPSGDLAGVQQVGSSPDVRYSRMYSHGIALLALAECYAMTGDQRLLPAVQLGCSYTLRAQNPTTGGWRYDVRFANEPGDLSQFGWQALAIQSCRRGGIAVAPERIQKMHSFLSSCSAGNHGGLAVYRPVARQAPSAAMTAEALAAAAMLRHKMTPEAKAEAVAMLLSQLPGRSEENLYYWYYATLAMFQQQGPAWSQWNASMKPQLVSTQISSGTDAGSWNPTGIWGGYGGRIYSTSMACMCLEVYYRYLPMYD